MPTRMLKDKPATIESVAAAAGVSAMTVSRVLRGKTNVSDGTRAKVMAAVDALGYVKNNLAGALASSGLSHVAVVVPSLRNIVFPEVLAGIADALEPTGAQPLIGISDYDLERELALVRSFMAWRPSGAILCGVAHHDETRRLLSRRDEPVVELMEISDDPIDISIGIDQHAAGEAMAAHLIKRGYRRFGYLGADHRLDHSARKRFEGFTGALAAAGAQLAHQMTVAEPSGIGIGRDYILTLLRGAPDIDAVFCSNDAVAAGAMMRCLAEAIAIPEQVALAGFGGLEIAASMPKPITTIRSPRYEMGRDAVGCILRRLAGDPVTTRDERAFDLVVGASA